MAILVSPVVRCEGLSCGYTHPVLANVSIEADPGTITVLLGANGSGKSTLLKTLVGTLSALGGSIRVDGSDIRTYRPQELARKVAYVPQEEAQQFDFTVEEVVTMGRLPHADSIFDSVEDLALARRAIATVGCAELARRSVMELSGGELQRVLIARAIAQGPKLLLMDEPTSHLDVHHALDLVQMLRGLAAAGLTVVAAVHDLNLASMLGDRAVLLRDGGVVAQGDAAEILRSEALERTYSVAFVRLEAAERLILVPVRKE